MDCSQDQPASQTIVELLRRRAEATPGGAALEQRVGEASWEQTNWSELWSGAERFAAALQAGGFQPGERLAIAAPASCRWLIAEMGALLAGACIIGVDSRAVAGHAAHVLGHGQSAALVAPDEAFVDRLPRDLRSALRLIVVDQEQPGDGADLLTWSEFLSSADNASPQGPPPTPRDPATLIFTSGSTGAPKAIEYTHGQIMAGCNAIVEAFPQLEQDDRTICWLPLSHLFQRMMNLVSIARGMVTYFLTDPRQILAAAEEVRPAFLIAVPHLLEKLHRELVEGDGGRCGWVKGVKFVITGTAPIAPSVLHSLYEHGLLVLEAYGLTENTVPMAANRRDRFKFGSVGVPFAANTLLFADDGELLVHGPGLFTGYLNEEPAEESFDEIGFYRTGDLGRLDDEGFLHLTGRKTEIIKTSTGRRISPAQIEAVYKQSPLIDQLVVVGEGRKYLTALLSPAPRAVRRQMTRREIVGVGDIAGSAEVHQLLEEEFARLGERLEPHQRIARFAILPEPLSVAGGELTANLKLRRRFIEEKYAELIECLYQVNHSTT